MIQLHLRAIQKIDSQHTHLANKFKFIVYYKHCIKAQVKIIRICMSLKHPPPKNPISFDTRDEFDAFIDEISCPQFFLTE